MPEREVTKKALCHAKSNIAVNPGNEKKKRRRKKKPSATLFMPCHSYQTNALFCQLLFCFSALHRKITSLLLSNIISQKKKETISQCHCVCHYFRASSFDLINLRTLGSGFCSTARGFERGELALFTQLHFWQGVPSSASCG